MHGVRVRRLKGRQKGGNETETRDDAVGRKGRREWSACLKQIRSMIDLRNKKG